MKLTTSQGDFLRLLQRSPDRGDGWRSVSTVCWPLVEEFGVNELLEIDVDNLRVRLTEKGETVAEYAI